MRCLCLSSEGRIVDEGVRKREVWEDSAWIYLCGICMCRRLSQFRKYHGDLNDHICHWVTFLHTDVHHPLSKLLFVDWATQSCTTKSVLVPIPWHHLVWGEPVPLSAQTRYSRPQLSADPFHNIIQHLISAVWLFFCILTHNQQRNHKTTLSCIIHIFNASLDM